MEEKLNDDLNDDNMFKYNIDFISDKEEKVKLIVQNKIEEKKSKDSLLNILQNLEKDLIVKNDCEKEFDLEQNNEDKYLKTEVFGSPCCYICNSSNKKDSSFQLFHCSHCNKLFCKQCLDVHYKSSYKNIKQSYMKYIDTGGNEEIIDKIIPKEASICRIIAYLIIISIFDFIYLLPIFAMKPIISTLEIIISNCIKEIFTYKVEDPDKLFNFYDIFFEEVNMLNLDFDLMMIMNWLGSHFLDTCGFVATTIIFIIVNFGYFVMLYNFDFIKYNEDNKYNFWKFMQLLLCYIVIFIGVGSSSLLSQSVFFELFKKYKQWEKEKIKEDDNIINDEEENQQVAKEANDNPDNTDNSLNNDNNNGNLENNNLIIELQSIKDFIKIGKKKNKRNKSFRESKLEKIRNKIKKTRLGAFFLITLITFLSFFFNFYINLEILKYRNKKDEKSYKTNNATFILEYINALNNEFNNTNQDLYERDKKFFFNIYLFYYLVCMIASIILYSIIMCCCLRKKKEEKEEKKEDTKWILINEDQLSIDQVMKDYAEKKRNPSMDPNILRNIEKDKTIQSYTVCNCCGFFYFSEKNNFRGNFNCCLKFLFCLKDCFVLNCKSLIDCCNVTFCHVLKNVFCCGNDDYNCECECCCDKISYSKQSERFCFCYQEKRKYKWFHDYITSQIQKDLAPYVLEYFILGLLIISFQKQFIGFRVDVPKNDISIFDEDGLTIEEGLKIWKDWKVLIIIILSLLIFFLLTRQMSIIQSEESKEKKGQKDFLKSQSFFNGIHILLLINSLISLFFSILYFFGIKEYGDYIIIPILMYQYFGFSFNYYCICVTEQENTQEFILSGEVLVSIYLYIWDIIYSLIQRFIENEEYIYFFQGVLSIVIIIFFSIYLVCSKYKYDICYNCVNLNLCGFLQACGPCCIYNTYCVQGVQICDCCCCDENSCCYSEPCESCYECCSCCRCFAEKDDGAMN